MKEQELSEHVDFIRHLFSQTKKEMNALDLHIKRLEKEFVRSPQSECILEDIQEIFETIQSTNQLLIMSK